MMQQKQVEAFSGALYARIKAETKRITASGDPDAAQDHLTMLKALNKINDLPYSALTWQGYGDHVLACLSDYKAHLQAHGYYGAPIIGSMRGFTADLLSEYRVDPPRGFMARLKKLYKKHKS